MVQLLHYTAASPWCDVSKGGSPENKMEFSMKRWTPPPLNGHNFQTPHFSFAIESYIYETDFYTWCQSKLSLLSPLIIGSKLTFSGWSDCWLPYSALKNLNVTRDSPPPLYGKFHWKCPFFSEYLPKWDNFCQCQTLCSRQAICLIVQLGLQVLEPRPWWRLILNIYVLVSFHEVF